MEHVSQFWYFGSILLGILDQKKEVKRAIAKTKKSFWEQKELLNNSITDLKKQ